MPSCSGVYFVYACTFNAIANTVLLRRLLYIGQASNINFRLVYHDKRPDWQRYLLSGETLCYACAQVDGRSLDLVEAAFVYKFKPVANDLLKNAYLHTPSQFEVSGQWPFSQLTTFSVP